MDDNEVKMDRSEQNLDRIKKIKTKYQDEWLRIPEVVAVGIGRMRSGLPGIVISLKNDSTAVRNQLPDSVEDVPLEIRIIGEIHAE